MSLTGDISSYECYDGAGEDVVFCYFKSVLRNAESYREYGVGCK